MIKGEEQFHLLVDAVKDYAIFMLDPQGVVQTWNAGAQRIKGYAPAEIVGRHFSLFYTPDDRAAGRPAAGLEQARAQGRYAAEGERVRKDGSRFYADVLITPVYKQGEGLVGYAKVTRDVTERHRLETQLRARVDELADADRRKDEFIAMLAHELRNPLAPVVTGLSIVQRGSHQPPAVQRALAAMERQLRLLSRLVDDLLQVSRMSRGHIELQRGHARLDAIVDQAMEIVAPQVQERRQLLEVRCEPGIDVYCDAQRMVQALTNVAGNASKYTAEGGSIRVTGRRDGDRARLTVTDTGIGIRSGMLERIFDMFTQDQSPAGTQMQGGLGIGLALARNIMAMHGGSISATSAGPDQGSSFELVLPLHAVGDHEPAPAGAVRQFRILVVDDNRDAADMVADLLRLEGYVVDTAYGGAAALQKAAEMHPHMILLDLLMPDLTGYEVIRRVRRNPGGPVVIAVTGHGSALDRDAVRQAGFDEHIVKPVVGDVVLGAVRRLLDGRSAHDPA